jgi:type III secretion protein HrpB1
MSKLAFSTPPKGIPISSGTTKQVGSVDVSTFSRIRVIARERAGSANSVTIRLITTEGKEQIGQFAFFQLGPDSLVTGVYDLPPRALTIEARALGSTGGNLIDLWIYGAI